MEKIGILIVAYGAREAAIADAFLKSEKYLAELYIVDKQKNPFNAKIAKKHLVIPDLNIKEICKFAKENKAEIDFGIVGPENPIIDGVRDLIEKETGIPMICPTRKYAIEKSKVEQRILLKKVFPEVNPEFKIFNPKDYPENKSRVIEDVKKWINELGGVEKIVIKPDKPGFGKGVGVGGEHFFTINQALEHFLSIYDKETQVIIEEKLDGEESSFQAWCDGKTLTPLPETRDYKRAFDGDTGVNTGGMGSYKSEENWLPFMTENDWTREIEIVKTIFKKLKNAENNPELRGIPFYVAFIHTKYGPKILEINSRPGDPEIINIMPLIKDDFIDVCFKMIDGKLNSLNFERKASVVTYAVPLTYGSYRVKFSGENLVDLNEVYKLSEKYEGKLKVYPASMELKNEKTYALKSRSVAIVGIGETIKEARELSLEGIKNIDGPLWNRWDIASEKHIANSIAHMKRLREL
jgi:phosphoribosylamine--glycine ligase